MKRYTFWIMASLLFVPIFIFALKLLISFSGKDIKGEFYNAVIIVAGIFTILISGYQVIIRAGDKDEMIVVILSILCFIVGVMLLTQGSGTIDIMRYGTSNARIHDFAILLYVNLIFSALGIGASITSVFLSKEL